MNCLKTSKICSSKMLLDQIFTKIIWISSTTLLPYTKWTVFAYEIDRSLLQTFLLRKLYEPPPDSDSNEVSDEHSHKKELFKKGKFGE